MTTDEGVDLRRAQWRGVGAIAERESLRVLRLWKQTLVPQILVAVLFIVVFGLALGDRIDTIVGVPYEQFIVPGLVLMGVGTAAFANNGTSIYQARGDGFIEDPVSSPMTPLQLLVGYLSGGMLRAAIIGVGIVAAARAFVAFPITNAALLVLVLVLAGLAFTALGTVVGLYARGWEHQNFVGNLVIQPLVFLGGVFYAVDDLPEPWQTISRFDPIFYMVDATREAMLGASEVSLLLSLGVTFLLAALMLGWAYDLFRRGVGLRT